MESWTAHRTTDGCSKGCGQQGKCSGAGQVLWGKASALGQGMCWLERQCALGRGVLTAPVDGLGFPNGSDVRGTLRFGLVHGDGHLCVGVSAGSRQGMDLQDWRSRIELG